ncbi:hypothetical protein [Haloarcula rara]|nr:hypothetical protein [Halomicroarcula sp. SHR3]
MDLVGDRRGQSIQIGAILLFAVLIIAFASYQAVVVPNQNRGVEFNHNQQVQSDMQDLRNAIVSGRGTGEDRSVSVQLGTRYPSRLVARNPSPPSGSLNTVGTTDESVALQISNAQAAGSNARETGDFWNESQTYNTGGLTYRPNYNVYADPPATTYEQTALYNQFPTGNITVSDQSFIDGTDISLVAINGSVSASSTQATSVDVRSVSSSTQRVSLENDSAEPINITFTSQRSAAYWDDLETSQPNVTNVTSTPSGNGFYNVSVELERGETYDLQLTKVGVGSGVTKEDTAYLTDVDGDGASVTQGETTELTLEVRDRFNNPPNDAAKTAVYAQADTGSLDRLSRTPDSDGQVTFEYTAPESGTPETAVNFSYVSSDAANATAFNAETVQNVSMTVDVTASSSGGGGGGGGAYSLNWADPEPDNTNAVLSDCTASGCTWDVGGSSDSTLTLRVGTVPALEGFGVEFAGDDSTVGSVLTTDTETDADGEATTDFNASENGTVGVYAASGGASDLFNLTVENVSSGGGGGGGGGSGQALEPVEDTVTSNYGGNDNYRMTFDIENTRSTAVTAVNFSVDDFANQGASTKLDNGNSDEMRIGGATTIARNGNTNADGTTYEFASNGGADITIGPGEQVEVWFRYFEKDFGDLDFVDNQADADLEVTIGLSDGTVQRFYFAAL